MPFSGLVCFLTLYVLWTCTEGTSEKPFLTHTFTLKFCIICHNTNMSFWQLEVILNSD